MPKVLVPIAQGCEEMEAVTVIDLLRRAGIEVVSAGLDMLPVKASQGVTLVPDTTLELALKDDFDMIVLPGGIPGTTHLKEDARIQHLVRQMDTAGKYVAAICAAPAVLAKAGVLQGKRATSYPGVLDQMNLPDTAYLTTPVVKDGRIITSRGPGTAMDFALELVETLVGKEKRDEVEARLQRPAN
ncbi:MAG TPA: DJ-1 family protein [Betaproteobacteria bacterium]|nr:DJ-1 family protein [Betaproteobacteria bacterium]